MVQKFKTNNINDTEMVYSLLREKYPERQINIQYNDNTKDYVLSLTDIPYKDDPEVPLDVKVTVVYGDSITGDTPLLLQNPHTGLVHIETIERIFDESKKVEYPGFKMFDTTVRLEKEYSTTDYQVWTDIGWVNIKRVIRHKTDKKIFRVLTHTGCVDVSEDHSLIRENLETVKPGELQVGDSLLHSFPQVFPENAETIVKMKKYIENPKTCTKCLIEKDISEYYKHNTTKDGLSYQCGECLYYNKSKHPLRNIMKNFTFEDYILTEKEAEVWGMFMGDGSCGAYRCESGIKNGWALNNNDLKRLGYFKDILESVEPVKFEILDTLKSSGVYKLVPKGSIKYMVEKYRKLFYYQVDCNAAGDKYKIVPNCILNASKAIKKAFFFGYYEADGSKTEGKSSVNKPSFAIKGKIGAQCLYYLARSIGFDLGLQLYNHPKKQEMYRLDFTNFKCKKETVVKKIQEKRQIRTDEFIYDLETDIGRFNCGVGQLQAVNTDSIFISIKYNRDDFTKNRQDTFNLATACGDNLTKDIFNRNPIELEFEKVFQPFILLTKKRYIGKKYENMKDPFKLKEITKSGIAITRRDYCKMVKNCYTEVIDCIVNEDGGGVYESTEIFKSYIDRIDNYQIDVEDLVVSAMLAKSYKTRPVHVILAEKLKARKEEVQVGSRISYIFIENTTGTVKQKSELGEDPTYAKLHNLKYNRGCYLSQLAKPLLGFFKVVLVDHQDVLNEIIDYTNQKLSEYGDSKLKSSDYTLE